MPALPCPKASNAADLAMAKHGLAAILSWSRFQTANRFTLCLKML
jgi:hypothetical protein